MMWGRPVRGSCVTKAAVLAAAFLLFALGAPLVAQPLHYGISPAEIELVPPPGGTASGILVVYNQSERRIRFTVSLEDIFIRPSGTMDVLAPGSVPWSAVALSKVTPAQFDLDPSRTMRVRITVTVPATARGGRYAVIVVSPTPDPHGAGRVEIELGRCHFAQRHGRPGHAARRKDVHCAAGADEDVFEANGKSDAAFRLIVHDQDAAGRTSRRRDEFDLCRTDAVVQRLRH